MANPDHAFMLLHSIDKWNEFRRNNPTVVPDLSGVNLSGANLSWANLRGAHLSRADLSWANLSWANLSETKLSWANLSWANLSRANLSWANLSEAKLSWTKLIGAHLSEANLSEADLSRADLSRADLSGANLSEANLSGAKLSWAKGVPELPHTVIASEGDLIVYKRVSNGVAKLLIPKEAGRSNATSRRCRAEWAVVLECPAGAVSNYDHTFVYREGKTVRPTKPFSTNRWEECAPGIHFFLTREEAENY